MSTGETFIYLNATYSSMEILLEDLKLENKAEEICKRTGLNINLLNSLFNWMMKGFNNKEVSEKLGINRVTVQRYVHTLRKLKESEFKILQDYAFLKKETKNETKIEA